MEKHFDVNPELFIREAIEKFVSIDAANRLVSFGGDPIFEPPLVGFADGADPLFAQYRELVHPEHFTPREILVKHLKETIKREDSDVPEASVISFVLPVHRETLKANALEKEGPSLRWNHTRWHGQDFIIKLSQHLVSLLEEMGVDAVAPELSPFFRIFALPDGFTSNWSHRHMAYAAGLGTFSLNEGFITEKGMAMRLGSVVAGLNLTPSRRPYKHFRANCLFYAGKKCGKCISRCPGGALSDKGHDKRKCFDILYAKQKPWLDGVYGPGYIGKYAGCGLCQTGVPCADRIPRK